MMTKKRGNKLKSEHPTAGILIIGNEILSGKVQDSNSSYLCRELRFLGVEVKRIATVPDELEVIGNYLREFSEAFTWVFTTGGVGPTHDDVTIVAVAQGFDVETEESEEMLELISVYYGERMNVAHHRMALIPKGAELLKLPSMRSLQLRFHNIFIFPGVPELVRNRFHVLKEHFRSGEIFLRQIFLNSDEGQIASILDETTAQFSELMLGSYPALWSKDYSLKLTLESRQEAYLDDAMGFMMERLPEEKIIRVE